MRFGNFGFGFSRQRRRRHWQPGALCLSDLQAGDHARIVEVGGSEHFRIRLMEMGLLAGETIEVSKYAPLQDPIEIILKGYHLVLRVRDAEKITVERIGN
ncbi:MAG: FeoA family protein [Candidatus Neomarinimicrobiota bacterium]